jgi:hypothetical protein
MNSQINTAEGQLENACQLFNQFSEKLADSYSDLENKVAQLPNERTETRNKRLLGMAKKEVLANRLACLLGAIPAGTVMPDSEVLASVFSSKLSCAEEKPLLTDGPEVAL